MENHWKYTESELPHPACWIICLRNGCLQLEFFPSDHEGELEDFISKFTREVKIWMKPDMYLYELKKMKTSEPCKPEGGTETFEVQMDSQEKWDAQLKRMNKQTRCNDK